MRIALRPSGGRGDYELAGSYNALHASDLLEKNFLFQISPNLIVNGKARAHRLSGKPRIRPEDGKHPYVVIFSILLLPRPRRELQQTPKALLATLQKSQYTIAGIDVDVVLNRADSVTFAPTCLWAKNQGGMLKVDFAERMAVITAIWNAASSQHSKAAYLLKKHYKAVVSSDHDQIGQFASAIQKHYRTDYDVVPMILRDLGLSDSSEFAYAGISNQTEGFETEENETSPSESLKDRLIKWRKQADRGPGARDFSIKVREAYDYRCLFSGERFPKLDVLDSAGVDGAHILPWSTHQLNSIVNGICLCKQCHWGFDNGLLRLDFDPDTNGYLLSIPESVEIAAREANFELATFKRNAGRIDSSRLPQNQDLWPSAKHLKELNAASGQNV